MMKVDMSSFLRLQNSLSERIVPNLEAQVKQSTGETVQIRLFWEFFYPMHTTSHLDKLQSLILHIACRLLFTGLPD